MSIPFAPDGVSVVEGRAYFEGECIGTFVQNARGFRGASLDNETRASGNLSYPVLLVLMARHKSPPSPTPLGASTSTEEDHE